MLFISHNSKDKKAAEEVLVRAIERGYSPKQVFLDSDPGSGFAAGELWELALHERLKQTRAMFVMCSPNWLQSKWCFIELGYARAMAISIFPVIVEQCDIRDTLGELQAVDLTTATDPAKRDAAFDRLWTALENLHLGPKENSPWPPAGALDDCPFPGLSYFDERYAAVFFGREQERDAIIQRLQAMRSSGVPRLLMIVGGSGSGKSSVLRGGVLPWLRHPTERREWIVLPTLRYGAIPNDDVSLLARLAEIVADAFPAGVPGRPDWKALRDAFESKDVEAAAQKLVDTTLDLGHYLGANAGADQGLTILFAIDQFEELLIARSDPSAAGFLRFLKRLLARNNGRLLVVGALRSDYQDVYEEEPEALGTPFFDPYRLPPLPWERVRDVIVKPAERAGLAISDELVERLEKDAPNTDALPLLAFTLEKLYRAGKGKTRELSDYTSIGGMEGSIKRSAEEIVPPIASGAEVDALRTTFVKHLAAVTEKGLFVRRTARWAALDPKVYPMLEKFVQARLLTKAEREGEVHVEVAHEALFRCWDRLNGWLRTCVDVLRWRQDVMASQQAANAVGRPWPGLTAAQLAVARDWPRKRFDVLTESEVQWIRKARLRQLMRYGAVAAVVALICGLGITAWEQKQHARAALVNFETLEGARLDEGGRKNEALATFAGLLRSNGASPLFRAWVSGLLVNNRPFRQIRHELGPGSASLSPDAKWILTAQNEGAAQIWGVADGMPVAPPIRHPALIFADFSPDAKRVVTAGRDGTAKVWESVSSKLVGAFRHADVVVSAAFRPPDGKWLVTASQDHTAQVWDVASGKPVSPALHHKQIIDSASFSPDGKWVVTASRDKTARVWDPVSGKPVGPPLHHEDAVSAASFSPNGKLVVTASVDKTARLWDPFTGEPIGPPLRHASSVSSASFSRDGKWILTASWDHTARVWEAATGKAAGPALVHENDVNLASFGPDGKCVLTVSYGIYPSAFIARVWQVLVGTPADSPNLADLAEAVSGFQLNDQGALIPVLNREPRFSRLRKLAKSAAETGSLRWFLTWFFSQPH